MHAPQTSAAPTGISFISPWGPTLADDDADDSKPAKHALFRELAFQVLRLRYPWLLQIIEATGCQVLARQGAFYIATPTAPDEWIAVPEIGESLHLVPWLDDGEIAQ